MELNNPAATDDDLWYVTNGLLVVEMVNGRFQIGDNTWDERPEPADVNIAGDPGERPTYADVYDLELQDEPATEVGETIIATFEDGAIGESESYANAGVTAAHHVAETDHSVASPFWTFMNSSGLVFVEDAEDEDVLMGDGQFVTDKLFQSPFYATGLPITEAYWSIVRVNGAEKAVLWQCFERRCLTYTPTNEPTWQVEAGNTGQHYYRWRESFEPAPAETLFVARLNGAQEVPRVETTATAQASFYLDEGDGNAGWVLRYHIEIADLEGVTAAHIHTGAFGVSGPPVAPLSTTATDGVIEGEIAADDLLTDELTLLGLVDQMIAGDTYVNFHTGANPGGEIRGQIAVADNVEFAADLTGAEEVPPVETTASGEAAFVYQNETDSLDCTLTVAGIDDFTASHIHWAAMGVSGPVVAPLYIPAEPEAPDGPLDCDVMESELAGPLTGASIEELVWGMIVGNTYVNVHSTTVPSGEIRGQIHLTDVGLPDAPFEVIATGLNNPRGIDFGADGAVYVAQAGAGGDHCITFGEGEDAMERCHGLTGAVSMVAADGTVTDVIDNLPSATFGEEIVGTQDVIVDGDTVYALVGIGGPPELRDALGADAAALGTLIVADEGGWDIVADLVAYEGTANPDGGAIDSNPYSFVMLEDGSFAVTDAGANALLHVAADGTVSTIAVFPDVMVAAPPFLELPPGTQIPMQAVPTGVTVGPDGAYYVGQLTGFPFPIGGASVWRVMDENDDGDTTDAGEVSVYADGFTNIIDVAFDGDGELYVLEIAANSLLTFDLGDPSTGPGRLVVVSADGETQTTVLTAGLITPAGLGITADGSVYASNWGVITGMGQVVELLHTAHVQP
jgi:hypothetical protein